MIAAQPVHAKPGPRGDQVVEIVADHGYRPQSIVARAGVPLRLIVRRRDDDVCMDRIVFSSPHIDRQLPRGSATTIVLPAQPAGEVRFTCGMGRYHGEIELRADSSPAIAVVCGAMAERLRRGWRLIRGPVQPIVDQEAMATVRARGPARGRGGRGGRSRSGLPTARRRAPRAEWDRSSDWSAKG